MSYKRTGDYVEESFRGLVRKNPNLDFILTNLGTKLVIHLINPNYIRDLTVNKNDCYDIRIQLLFIDLYMKEGIGMTSGDKWRR